MKFLEICVFEDCDLEDTSLANKPKIFLKNVYISLQNRNYILPPIAKVMENQNFERVYLGTMILRLQTY